jgi:cyanuric acid amidohydrolase
VRAHVHRLPACSPDDVSALDVAFARGQIDAKSIVAILGKTEGNGCVNDFTRSFAVSALKASIAAQLGCAAIDLDRRIAFVMSGGTEGGLSPHWLVFEAREEQSEHVGEARLAIGVAFTPRLRPEHIGRREQITATALAVRDAMSQAQIASVDDVHYVQVKCPLLTRLRISEAEARGQSVATQDTYASMGVSRGAAALGVALSLGECDEERLSQGDAVCREPTIFSTRASCSAGVELMDSQIMVLGNSRAWSGNLVIGHGVMEDALDVDGVWKALALAGIADGGQLDAQCRSRIAAVLAKAEASTSGQIRGRRHIMLDDSDIPASRHARALVGGVLAGVFGDTQLFVSGGAEHQGPDGGGPIAVIAHCDPTPKGRAAAP